VADILSAYEIARDTWHCPAINGHSAFSEIFSLSALEGQLLVLKIINTVSQLMEMDDLTGCLTTAENRALMLDLISHPLLQYKLHLLIRAL
jgi:hypothetical protein